MVNQLTHTHAVCDIFLEWILSTLPEEVEFECFSIGSESSDRRMNSVSEHPMNKADAPRLL